MLSIVDFLSTCRSNEWRARPCLTLWRSVLCDVTKGSDMPRRLTPPSQQVGSLQCNFVFNPLQYQFFFVCVFIIVILISKHHKSAGLIGQALSRRFPSGRSSILEEERVGGGRWDGGDEGGEGRCEGGVCGRKARVMKPF